MRRLKVLLIAHELSPIKGSECGVGWNIASRLSAFHDVTVLYSSGSYWNPTSYLNAVNSHIKDNGPIPGLTFIDIPQPKISRFIASINNMFVKLGPTGLPMLYYLGYKYWHKSAFSKAKKLHEKSRFEIVHQLTQISFREPGFGWKLNVPFIWGPTGGTSKIPKDIYNSLPLQFKIFEKIRSFSNIYRFKLVPRLIKANKKASIIYAFSNADANKLKKKALGKVKIMLDVGTSSHAEVSKNDLANNSMLRGVWCGRLSDYKAPAILLGALGLSQATKDKVRFQIIGSGSLENSLLKMADGLNLTNIEWIKEVKHSEIFAIMANADFFVHTSIREATSSVIPEALSMGLPVICHDAFGMGIAINEKCGIKVPFISPEKSIKGFHDAIERLILDRSLLEKLKKGARERALEISWDKMVEEMANDYLEVAGHNS